MNFDAISWANNQYLIVLFVPFIAIAFLGLAVFLRKKTLKQLCLTDSSKNYNPPKWRLLQNILLVSGMFFTSLSILAPQWGEVDDQYRAEGLDLCIALDLSKSMNAEDILPSRLKAAKNQIAIFVRSLGGDRVALTGFAGSAYVAAPLTIDYASFSDFMDPLQTDFMSDQATNIAAGVDSCLSALGLDKAKDTSELEFESSKVILLVTDGEDTVEDYDQSVKRAIELQIPLYSVVMGTIQGANIPIRDSEGSLEGYVKDPETQAPVTSKTIDKALLKLAEQTNAKVFYSSQGVSAWELLHKALQNYKRSSKEAGATQKKEHRFQLPLFLAIVCLLLGLLLPETAFSWKRLLLPLLLFSFSPNVFSLETLEELQDTFINNQGVSKFENKKLNEATNLFSDVISQTPDHYIARFNWSTTKLHEFFEQTKKSGDKNSDNNIDPKKLKSVNRMLNELLKIKSSEKMKKGLHYQKGFSEELGNNPKQALIDYYQILENSTWPELEEKARNNIARLLVEQNQKNQSKGQGEGSGQGEGDGSGNSREQSGEQQQNKSQKPQFDQTDINEDQAKKILSSVSSQEKDVQQRKAQAEAGARARKNKKDGQQTGQRGRPW